MGDSERLVCLGAFITMCILPDGYTFPSGLASLICLTPDGRDLIESVDVDTGKITTADTAAVALAAFTAGDVVLVDSANTDDEAVRDLLSPEIAERRIRYPWVFGRHLDRHYASMYAGAPSVGALPAERSYSLLDGVPQGVAQLRDLVVGPYGILSATDLRHTPPMTCGPSFRCSDFGCTYVHHVRLTTATTAAGKLYNALLTKHPRSERVGNYVKDIIVPDEQYYDIFNDDNMPWLLGNGLTASERQLLIRRMISRDAGGNAERLSSLGIIDGDRNRWTPAGAALSDAHVLQLLLTFSTASLTEHLEGLLDDRELPLSPSEVRTAVLQRHTSGGVFKTELEISRAGVGFHPRAPVPVLRTFLRALYEDAQDELAFLLRDCTEALPFDRLDAFLRSATEREVLRRLIFVSRATLLKAFKELRYGRFAIPTSTEEQERLEERLLWKLGGALDPPARPDARLIEFAAVLRDVVAAAPPELTEPWVSAVRSAGMDFFVEAEALLASGISFAGWLLMFDHYEQGRDRFRFSRARAQRWTTRLLNDAAVKDFTFSARGNAMGTLLQAGPILANLAEDTLAHQAEYQRQGVPTYAQHTRAQIFPFRHTRPVCDLSDQSVGGIIAALRGVQAEFSRGDAAGTRNRLGHPPATFPSAKELERALDAVLSGVGEWMRLGLVPTIYRVHESSTDGSGREVRTLRDGSGREFALYGPSELRMSGMALRDDQLVIVPGAIVRDTSQPFCFRVLEDTDFAQEWSDYRNLEASEPHSE